MADKEYIQDIFGGNSDDKDLFADPAKSAKSKDDFGDIFGENAAARDNELFSEPAKALSSDETEGEGFCTPPSDSVPVFDIAAAAAAAAAEPPAEPPAELPAAALPQVHDVEKDIFDDPPPKKEEVATDDKLFEEETTEIFLDEDIKTEPSKPEKLSAGMLQLDLDSPYGEGKTSKESEEEEGGDTFDINIKISDPIKVGDGMNAYMAYSVTTQTSIASFRRSEFSVKRRFSDFLGLHERLSEKHVASGRIVPPPPDKSVVGMVKVKGSKDDQTSTDFVYKRKHALEKFLNRISRHKILLDDADFREFLEAEELPRAKNTSALSKGGLSRLAKGIGDAVSKMTSKMVETDSWFEDKQSRVEDLDQQVRKLHAATDLLYTLRKEVVINTAAFAKSVSLLSNSEEHSALSRALALLAEVEEKIEQTQEEQASNDLFLLSETLKEYIGLIASVKAAFSQRVKVWGNWQSAQSTLSKKREALVKFELAGKSDKINAAKEEVVEWERRVEKGEEEFDSISKIIKVEVANFETMRVKDFKDLIVNYLESLLGIEQQFVKYWEGFAPVAKSIC